MTWTKITKPTSRNWTNLNPVGRTQYDQADVTYDSAFVFFDGNNPNEWTKVAKPTGGSLTTIIVGTATGLLIPPTYATAHTVATDSWNRVPKPIA